MTDLKLTELEAKLTKVVFSDDTTYYPKWFEELGYDADAVAAELLKLPFADRNSKWMKLRGHPLKRDKCTYVSSLEKVPIYRYTGFQWKMVVEEYRAIETAPILASLQHVVKTVHGHTTNHIIGTRYNDKDDNIGWHNDKTKSLSKQTPVIMFNFLEQRPLAFRPNPTEECKDPKVICEVPNAHGSVTIMGLRTNEHYQHAILPSKTKLDQRISLILREVTDIVPMTEIVKKAKGK